ncbi:MAG: hypothetical protein L0Z50_28155 [Verrucomicrobiales bacterium]|nr:hypothetical protein [Verrucomicrobiales bacterium]
MNYMKQIMAALAIVGIPAAANAQYLANWRTTASDTDSSVVTRLFLDSGFTTLAPVGSRLWVVADTAGNGLPTYGPGVQPDQVLGPDDQILFQDVIDGTILGSQPGKYQRDAISVADLNSANQTLYTFLWGNGNPMTEAAVAGGNAFGVFNMGINPIPPVGNAEWFVSGNINGNAFTVVPEPAAALYAGLGLAALGLIRYRFGKRPRS